MTTEDVWKALGPSLYLFILKRVGVQSTAQDVLQNTFLKVHEHLQQLDDHAKVKPWAFQIARNEVANHFRKTDTPVPIKESVFSEEVLTKDDFCCFEQFIEELPDNLREVIQLVYVKGKTNAEAANELDIGLASTKARIRRAKNILKERLSECCSYESNASGKLVGEPNCAVCNTN